MRRDYDQICAIYKEEAKDYPIEKLESLIVELS